MGNKIITNRKNPVLRAFVLLAVAMAMPFAGCSAPASRPAPAGTEKDKSEWWKTAIAYEAYPRSFCDSGSSGQGTIKGITSKLDHLEKLGVGLLWITPVYKSPMVDGGYDVADYYNIDPSFGTMEEMDELIAKADSKGIKIVMDLVFNHTSDQCEWFKESRKDKTNEYADWYVWRDPAADGGAPTNWRSIFGGSAWEYCEERGQYYLHTFASAQPDLNWENPEVRKALSDIANFWVDKGVGGFRLDAITYIKKPAEFKSFPADAEDGLYSVHDATANTKGILDFLHEICDPLKAKGVFIVGETNGVAAEELPQWVGKDGFFSMVFEFSHMHVTQGAAEKWCYSNKGWKLTDLKSALTDTQKNTADNGWCPVFFENHDQPRSINNFIKDENYKGTCDAAKMLGTVLLTLRGTPFIYQGEELGYANISWTSLDSYDDVNTRPQYDFAISEGFTHDEALSAVWEFSRDNARTPMQWTPEDNAGFTSGTPWLPIHDDYKTCNVQTEANDADSVLRFYYKLSDIRKTHEELVKGDYEEIFADSEEIYAFTRSYNGKKAIVLANFSGHEAQYDASIVEGAKLISNTCEQAEAGKLEPMQALIYEIG